MPRANWYAVSLHVLALSARAGYMQGARGEDQGGPAQAGGAGAGSALRALRAGRADHRLSLAQGDDGRTPGRAHRHRVPDAGRAFGQRRAGADPRAPATTGLGTGQGRRLRAGENIVKRLRRKLGDDADNPNTSSPSRVSAIGCRRGRRRRSRDRLFVVIDEGRRLPSAQPLLSDAPLVGTLPRLIRHVP